MRDRPARNPIRAHPSSIVTCPSTSYVPGSPTARVVRTCRTRIYIDHTIAIIWTCILLKHATTASSSPSPLVPLTSGLVGQAGGAGNRPEVTLGLSAFLNQSNRHLQPACSCVGNASHSERCEMPPY